MLWTLIRFFAPWFFWLVVVPSGLRWAWIHIGHSRSSYQSSGGVSSFKVAFFKGYYGEYLIFRVVEKLASRYNVRLLTNVYVPKGNGETTEIDVVMISQAGIFVFESKNYSGWIFGDERQKMWMQTFRKGKKQPFYNPIWQNRGHVAALKPLLPDLCSTCFHSYIVFSDRCELRSVNVSSSDVVVLKRKHLGEMLRNDMEQWAEDLSLEEVQDAYNALQQYINVGRTVREAHVRAVQKYR